MFQISEDQEFYIINMILGGTDRVKEARLEDLCNMLNRGGIPHNPIRLCQTVVSLFEDGSNRLKRWAFNAMALLGRFGSTRHQAAIEAAILRHRNEPDLMLGAVTALFAVCRDDVRIFKWLSDNDIAMQGALITACAPFSKGCQEALMSQKIDIDNADPLTLQNACILIGLNKVPENVFSDRHPYKGIIGRLNAHDDHIVSQYSIWAIAENSKLGIADLGIRIDDVEKFPLNVRKWLCRALAGDKNANKYMDVMEYGCNNGSLDIREKLAEGLKDNYFKDCDKFVMPWYAREEDEQTKLSLLDHMAGNADNSEMYFNTTKAAFDKFGLGSDQRKRIIIAANGTRLYSDLKKKELVQLQLQSDLFGGDKMTVININNSQVGVLNSESVFLGSSISQAINDSSNQDVKNILRELKGILEGQKISSDDEKKIADAVSKVSSAPSKVTLNGLADCLRTFGSINGVAELAMKVAALASVFLL
jgi:hypothetical protein